MSTHKQTASLPQWDLTHLFSAPEGQDFIDCIKDTHQKAVTFESKNKGSLKAENLLDAVKQYETIDCYMTKIDSYVGLLYAANCLDGKITAVYQKTHESLNDMGQHLIFFSLELNGLSQQTLDDAYKATPKLTHYKPWLKAVRAFKPHELDGRVEKVLHEKSLTSRNAWVRLFDETMAQMQFPYDDKKLSEVEIWDRLTSPKEKVRKKAYKSFGKTLKKNGRLLSLITNTLAKDKAIEDKLRHFKTPQSARNLDNQIEDSVVETLITTVKQAYPDISHRYYKLKARFLGKKVLDDWDSFAPIPGRPDDNIPWEKAKQIVLDAYQAFSPEMAKIGRRFFDESWIDARPQKGKDSGAFADPVTPYVHPYILLNYQGKTQDVMTLAHELGHGIHQVLAGQAQGHLISQTPLTLAETASIFGEMLVFKNILASFEDKEQRKIIIATKVEDMIRTIVRQTAFYDFESQVHEARLTRELSTKELNDIWLKVSEQSLGPWVKFHKPYAPFWSSIPHFISVPFYVYAYSFGNCLVNALYTHYEEHPQGFQDKYITLLKTGGAKRHQELLAPFDMDIRQKEFWEKGLKVISTMIDELEEMA